MSISLQPLLERITLLNKKYEGVAEITGENYNIFRILQVESSEVRLHSAFIANLLDPKASHGQKKSFLKAFIEEFKITRSTNIDIIDVEINVEEFIGNKNEDCTSGGRIDIVVKANNEAIIVIENKIYAEDQLKQLIRYNNRYPNAKLLYLTLDGCEPDDSSIKNDNGTFLKSGEDFFCVSYKRDVLNWLKLCKEKAVNHPLLRETITQYINLIKHLTNQTMNEELKKEMITDILSKSEYIDSAEKIADTWYDVRLEIMERVKNEIIINAKRHGLNVQFDEGYTLGLKDSSFWFFKPEWKYCICFAFDSEFGSLYIGITTINNNSIMDSKFLKLITPKTLDLNFGKNISYKNYAWIQLFKTWDNTEWKDVTSKIPSAIQKAVNEIISNTKDIPW